MSLPETLKISKKAVAEVLHDYRIACISRETSLLGRKEVFMGKAKFGIFGDGKEIAQIAMAKAFRKGDFRSGYYRDQTFMFAIGELQVKQYFAQLYAHTSVELEPASAGRMMNGHYGTRMLDEKGKLKKLSEMHNCISDISPTAGQIPRVIGLGYASKLFRHNKDLHHYKDLSKNGDEVVFATIGNAATSEGMFLEAVNAAGVLQIPVIYSVWDDGYGISVPNEYHTTKCSISEVLKGFQRDEKHEGIEIFSVKGWDYEALIETYKKAADLARKNHIPSVIHVEEMTQPQGHSTSGSHERYKPRERLAWEIEYDCIKKMKTWILDNEYAEPAELAEIENEAKVLVKKAKLEAWQEFNEYILKDVQAVSDILEEGIEESKNAEIIHRLKSELDKTVNPIKLDIVRTVKMALRSMRGEDIRSRERLTDWLRRAYDRFSEEYSSHLYSESDSSSLKVNHILPVYNDQANMVDGREVLQACFDAALAKYPLLFSFGEDVGKIGDVNQAFAGLQAKFGELRVTDTGIRETTIIGQGIGAALRGLKPIAEIQYLDYVAYAMATLTDDLATLQYRTKGGQKAPLVIRTRGHRLEGIWHTGSPMGMLLGSLRGIYILVPRNMTQAAGMYNVLFRSDDAAIMIESLNGYRLKERVPENIGEFTVPFGEPEILKQGTDITIVTYGSMCRIVMAAVKQLQEYDISCEVIDVQTLIPFDIHETIVDSLKKTNRVIFADEDVPGGATSYMMGIVLDKQNGYDYLDAKPRLITAKEHRAAY
ncbi:MAG: thiamine pyrophosphate-dependent enzyme, partial [Cyclobacteriaceae bacterium]|nr:thiamine pyrophosphate-dependent enzyme [Cyclobacteriaceae bacterium]